MKYVLLTGAYGGMGKSVANYLKEKGYTVFALDITVGEKEDGIIPIPCDLTNQNSVNDAFTYVSSITNSLYAILHFGGIYRLDSLVEMEEKDYLSTFDVNVFGAYRINKTFLPLLKKGSRIVITSSELAPLDPLPFTGVYAITKSALEKYAYSLRMELQLLDIDVVVLRPGAVKTSMLGDSTTALDKFCQKTTLYNCNAKRFKSIVEKVEAKNIPPKKVAKLTAKILKAKRPSLVYSINRNPLLLLLNVLPQRLQTWIIKLILK